MRRLRFKDVANDEYLLRSRDKDVVGRQDIFEVYLSNSHKNQYTVRSLFTGMSLHVDGNQEVIKYEIFKIMQR